MKLFDVFYKTSLLAIIFSQYSFCSFVVNGKIWPPKTGNKIGIPHSILTKDALRKKREILPRTIAKELQTRYQNLIHLKNIENEIDRIGDLSKLLAKEMRYRGGSIIDKEQIYMQLEKLKVRKESLRYTLQHLRTELKIPDHESIDENILRIQNAIEEMQKPLSEEDISQQLEELKKHALEVLQNSRH